MPVWRPMSQLLLVVPSLMLTGCAAQLGQEAPFEAMGMPAAPLDDITSMFDVTHFFDGAPTQALHRGKRVGLWMAVSSTEEGCIEYQLLPDRQDLDPIETPFFWHGDKFRPTEEGCVPVMEVEHSPGIEGDQTEDQPPGMGIPESHGGGAIAASGRIIDRDEQASADSLGGRPLLPPITY